MNNSTQQKTESPSEREIRAEKEKDKNPGALYVLNNEHKAFLNLTRLPARLNTAQTAACLGFKPHDIPILIARGFLKPLGHPMPNCEKYFARVRIQEKENDEKWLALANDALSQHWRMKNGRKSRIVVNQP
jgi:hypothetical protein